MSQPSLLLKIENFEGPLDLLLHLVSSYKVDIFEVPLVAVIEQYLEAVKGMQELNLELAGDYMLMASQLMLIKSRKLLPTEADEFVEETEQLEQDLLIQIDEYRRFKEVSQTLTDWHAARARFYSKPRLDIVNEEVHLLHDTNAIDLFLAFSQMLRQRQQMERANHRVVEAEKFRVEDKIELLQESFSRRVQLRFSELFADSRTKEELITTFLAVLELVKTDFISINQPEAFGEITLSKNEQ